MNKDQVDKLINELKQYKNYSKVIDIDFVIILINNTINENKNKVSTSA
jgi:hypothetical protein